MNSLRSRIEAYDPLDELRRRYSDLDRHEPAGEPAETIPGLLVSEIGSTWVPQTVEERQLGEAVTLLRRAVDLQTKMLEEIQTLRRLQQSPAPWERPR